MVHPVATHIGALRARIADQRKRLSDQCQVITAQPTADPTRRSTSMLGIGAAVIVTVLIASHRRTRALARTTVSAGWLVWRGLRLVQSVTNSFRNR